MSGALQAVFQNLRSFGRAIGSPYEGGYYAGQISTAGNGIADYNLVVGPKSSTDTMKQFRTAFLGGDPTSVIDGPANSSTMNNASHPAAEFCEGLTVGGFSDWYLPAKNELEVCYYNLKPTTADNYTSSGINANAVPARASNYTATGAPFQTSATDFQTGGSEFFGSGASYWTSTQSAGNPIGADGQYFGSGASGYQVGTGKTTNYKVRAIRRVAV